MGKTPVATLLMICLWSACASGSWGRSPDGTSPTRLSPNGRTPAKSSASGQLVKLTFSLINEDRAKNGSPPVEQDPTLSQLAQTYAEYLLRTGNFGHVDKFGRNPDDRARYFGINESVSENLAYEESDFETPTIMVRRAQESMMAEPPTEINHRYNILNPQHRYVGIGVAQAGEKLVVVHEFAANKPELATNKPE